MSHGLMAAAYDLASRISFELNAGYPRVFFGRSMKGVSRRFHAAGIGFALALVNRSAHQCHPLQGEKRHEPLEQFATQHACRRMARP